MHDEIPEVEARVVAIKEVFFTIDDIPYDMWEEIGNKILDSISLSIQDKTVIIESPFVELPRCIRLVEVKEIPGKLSGVHQNIAG
jgi:hypothetical protein